MRRFSLSCSDTVRAPCYRFAKLMLTGVLFGMLSLSAPVTALTYEDARHVLARTTFGGSEAEIIALLNRSRGQTVKQLLANVQQHPVTSAPAWTDEPLSIPRRKPLDSAQRKALQAQFKQHSLELKQWWYHEMLTTPSPLTERLTLFWHNHFTSSLQKVRNPTLMFRQNLTLRRHAAGNLRALLRDILRDPAMLLYLDNAKNRIGHVNENLARELLELFTLGEGHYTERDVQAAAQVLTGHTLDPHSGTYVFNPAWHASGEVHFLGKTGELQLDDLIDAILEQPHVAVYITEKLWREFISATPEAEEITRLAAIFRQSNYEIKPLLEALWLSPAFWSSSNRGVLIKSPVEFLVGTVRTLQPEPLDTRALALAGRRLGQDLFNPPNVKGWRGGTAWIKSHSLLMRQDIVRRLIAGRAAIHHSSVDTSSASRLNLEPLPDAGLLMAALLLPISPSQPLPETTDKEMIVRQLLLDPVFQLK